MNIGIIGCGNVGTGLAKLWSKNEHNVLLSYSHDQDKVERSAAALGPRARAGTPAEAASFGEIVLLATPWAAVEDALQSAGANQGSLEGKVLLECTNPLTSDFSGMALGYSTSGSEEIARLARGARVVKAFNTVFAQILHADSQQLGNQRVTVFYCGDDTAAKADVARLIEQTGFEPVDAGPLKNARYVEPAGMLIIQLGYRLGLGTGISYKLAQR